MSRLRWKRWTCVMILCTGLGLVPETVVVSDSSQTNDRLVVLEAFLRPT